MIVIAVVVVATGGLGAVAAPEIASGLGGADLAAGFGLGGLFGAVSLADLAAGSLAVGALGLGVLGLDTLIGSVVNSRSGGTDTAGVGSSSSTASRASVGQGDYNSGIAMGKGPPYRPDYPPPEKYKPPPAGALRTDPWNVKHPWACAAAAAIFGLGAGIVVIAPQLAKNNVKLGDEVAAGLAGSATFGATFFACAKLTN